MVGKLNLRRSLRGYTIIEVLVAVILLAIALPGLAVMLTGSRKTQVSSLRMEQGMSYGQLIVDSLSLLPATARGGGSQLDTTQLGSTLYIASWQIPAVAGGAYSFPVTVSWRQGSHQHSVQIQAVLR